MQIFRKRNFTLSLLTGLVAVAALVILAANRPQRVDAQQEIFLDWSDGPENCSSGIFAPPANCATWHEISPAFCTDHHQDGFEDNGDGVVSVCDYITLDNSRYHVVNVGPTLYLDCSPGGQNPLILEPVSAWNGDPMEAQWVEIYPENGGYFGYMESWVDNGDGQLSVCDEVVIAGITCHVKRVGCNIRVVSAPPNATEQKTWGNIKAFFGF